VTDEAYQRLKSRYTFEQRSPIQVKGKGEMVTYVLTGRRAEPAAARVAVPPLMVE
jgi:hypothetical protein